MVEGACMLQGTRAGPCMSPYQMAACGGPVQAHQPSVPLRLACGGGDIFECPTFLGDSVWALQHIKRFMSRAHMQKTRRRGPLGGLEGSRASPQTHSTGIPVPSRCPSPQLFSSLCSKAGSTHCTQETWGFLEALHCRGSRRPRSPINKGQRPAGGFHLLHLLSGPTAPSAGH